MKKSLVCLPNFASGFKKNITLIKLYINYLDSIVDFDLSCNHYKYCCITL